MSINEAQTHLLVLQVWFGVSGDPSKRIEARVLDWKIAPDILVAIENRCEMFSPVFFK